MQTQIDTLTARLEENQRRLERAEQRQAQAERRARLSWACALGALVLTVLLNIRPAVLAQSPGVSLASLLTRIQALEQKTAPLNVSGTDLTFTGVNVRIVNGLGATNGEPGNPTDTGNPVVNGLGNLILGYNALRNNRSLPDRRTGSHNLILGDETNYTAYGGIVAGVYNTASGPYASVTGGAANTASGDYSSASGGYANTASGIGASIGGGFTNTASGYTASVSGGPNLTQSNDDGWAAGNKGSTTYSGNFTSP